MFSIRHKEMGIIQLANELSNSHYMVGTFLDTRTTEMEKQPYTLPYEAYILVERDRQ